MQPFWKMELKRVQRELATTNILPLVLTQAAPKHTSDVEALAKLTPYEPRRLIVTGSPDVVVPKPMKRIETDITRIPLEDLAQLPMEILGAAIIRRHCRREPLDAPMESREARRERMLEERKGEDGLG